MARRVQNAAVAAVASIQGPWKLPDGWRWERLDVAAHVNPSRTFSGLRDDDQVAFIPMAAVGEFGNRIDASDRRAVRAVKTGYTRMYSGDVVLAKITPCMENGKLAIVPDVPHGCAAGTTEFHVLEPQRVSARYLFYWLNRQSFRQDARYHMTGTAGQKRVPADWLRSYPIPVPPVELQEHIVSHIDGLFASVDAGEHALAEARAGFDTYRSSLLTAAVTGQLTADWRQNRKCTTQTREESLRGILKERRVRWEASDKKRRLAYSEPAEPALLAPFALPQDWCWASLGQLSERITDGTHQPPKFGDNGVPFVVIGDIRGTEIDWSNIKKFVSNEVYRKEAERLKPIRGDILYTAVGSYGTALVVRDEREFMFQRHIAYIRPSTCAWTDYLVLVLNSPLGRAQADRVARGVAQKTVTLGDLCRFSIPLPPLKEISVILDRVSTALDRLKNDVFNEASDAAAVLRQSILSAAFHGELL